MKRWAMTLLAVWLGCVATRAEDLKFTVGIGSRCRYGLIPCWPEVREPLEQMDGVKSVSQRADPETWTCQIETKDGRLPDLQKWKKQLQAGAGEVFWIRAVEATLEGEVFKDSEHVVFRLKGSGAVLRLQALQEKAQRDQKPTDTERGAYERLTKEWSGPSRPARITGLLVESGGLEVREFAWR